MSQADGVIDADILRAAAPVPVAGGATDTTDRGERESGRD